MAYWGGHGEQYKKKLRGLDSFSTLVTASTTHNRLALVNQTSTSLLEVCLGWALAEEDLNFLLRDWASKTSQIHD